jgi:hypothetical protein
MKATFTMKYLTRYEYTDNKILAIKTFRTVAENCNIPRPGIKESKDIFDSIFLGHSHTFTLEVGEIADLNVFTAALNAVGMVTVCHDSVVADPFKALVIDAVTTGNYKYALALLKANIDHAWRTANGE